VAESVAALVRSVLVAELVKVVALVRSEALVLVRWAVALAVARRESQKPD